MNYLLFVGAGVEIGYHLPSGASYTEKTLLYKREFLYKQLAYFYKPRITTDYCGKYEQHYLFAKNSTVFRSIIQKAIWRLAFERKTSNEHESMDSRLKELINFIRAFPIADEESIEQLLKDKKGLQSPKKQLNEKGKSFIDDCYDSIVFIEGVSDESQIEFNALKNELRYHGMVEQYFSTIIDPQKIGPKNFWKLINYFWSAYFTILLPILDNSEYADIDEYKKNKYEYVLNNLSSIIGKIYSHEFIESYKPKDNKDYYKVLADQLQPAYVATTNYTPFVNKIGCKKDTPSFLAGELRYFEDPTCFKVAPYSEFKEDAFVFPFLMTQAPIKPIVSTYQLENYSRFLSHLKKVSVVVIVGFSLCEEDNHINALLHDYLCDEKKHLIFCDYVSNEQSFDEIKSLNKVKDSLRFKNQSVHNIHIIESNGNPEELVKRIRSKFDELAKMGVKID